MKNNLVTFCLTALSIIVLSGCGNSLPDIGGTVTVDGTIIKQGDVTFYPLDGGRSGSGRIGPDGTYVVSYLQIGDGMPPGEYKVAIVADEFIPSKNSPKEEDLDGAVIQQKGVLKHIIPKVYNSKTTTPLRCTIAKGGDYSDYDLEISTTED